MLSDFRIVISFSHLLITKNLFVILAYSKEQVTFQINMNKDYALSIGM